MLRNKDLPDFDRFNLIKLLIASYADALLQEGFFSSRIKSKRDSEKTQNSIGG